VAAITDNLGDPTGSDAQAPDPQIPTLDDANTQRTEYEVEFKKNCKKGLSCGGSCISREKMCIRSLDPETKVAVKALKDMVKKSGSPGAIAARK
jgi:hypothetical protein